MKLHKLLLVSILSLFLTACGSEVVTGIVEDDPIKTAQYVSGIYDKDLSEDEIEFIDTDYGENIGIVPTFMLNDDENSGVIRLNNDKKVEAVFFRNVHPEQINQILSDIGIEENTGFNRTIEDASDPYNEGHKTKYKNMNLGLTSNFAFFTQLDAPSTVKDFMLEDLDLEAFLLTIQFE
ncbi:MAG TPA: hypothetical protein VFC64_03680 [Atopostipes sp.]|nr:hypothetical protein [Atopostipes sp.]